MITLYILKSKVKLNNGTKYGKGYVLTESEFKEVQEEYRTVEVTVVSIPKEMI